MNHKMDMNDMECSNIHLVSRDESQENQSGALKARPEIKMKDNDIADVSQLMP